MVSASVDSQAESGLVRINFFQCPEGILATHCNGVMICYLDPVAGGRMVHVMMWIQVAIWPLWRAGLQFFWLWVVLYMTELCLKSFGQEIWFPRDLWTWVPNNLIFFIIASSLTDRHQGVSIWVPFQAAAGTVTSLYKGEPSLPDSNYFLWVSFI